MHYACISVCASEYIHAFALIHTCMHYYIYIFQRWLPLGGFFCFSFLFLRRRNTITVVVMIAAAMKNNVTTTPAINPARLVSVKIRSITGYYVKIINGVSFSS